MTFRRGQPVSHIALGDDLRGQHHQRLKHGMLADEQPYTRVGICCGMICKRHASRRGKPDVPLYRSAPDRYRCRSCFRHERGYLP